MAWRRNVCVFFGCCLALAGCGDDDGPIEVDAGSEDSGTEVDADMADAGPMLVPACDSTTEAVYETPGDLPAYDEELAGRIVRCAAPTSLAASRIQELATLRGYEDTDLTTSVSIQLFSYRTPRANGTGALSSAQLFLPDPLPSEPMPLIVVAHPTTGLADACAPSLMADDDSSLEDTQRMLMPLLGSGHAVVMTDYIGMGTEGTVGFLNAREAGTTVLDSARAALMLAPEGTFDGKIFLVGHSQGGNAVLSAQAIAGSYAPELDILGVTSLAPPWFNVRPLAQLGSASSLETGAIENFAAMWAIGQQATTVSDASAFDVLFADNRDALRTHYSTQCIYDLSEGTTAIAPTVGELFSEGIMRSFRCTSFGTCPDDPWGALLDDFRAELDADGPPFWIHLGSMDNRSPMDSVTCDSIRPYRAEGLTVGACGYELNHNMMALVPMQWVRTWVAALSAGEAAPTCDESLLPTCE
ncbi:MAG: alpha/beta fold hydrolase [Sandaracinus sp.]|nr:alpha/beta fold hydrolase [Sandaracinus sp.]